MFRIIAVRGSWGAVPLAGDKIRIVPRMYHGVAASNRSSLNGAFFQWWQVSFILGPFILLHVVFFKDGGLISEPTD